EGRAGAPGRGPEPGPGHPRPGAGGRALRPLARPEQGPARGLPVRDYLRVAAAVAGKDLKTELRSREMLPALGQFVVLALLIANFGFDLETGGTAVAPGVLWLTVTFAGLVAFGRAFASERDQGSLEPLLLTPANRSAIFGGKALAAAALLALCEAVLVPALGVFFNAPVLSLPLVATLVLATV